MKILVCGGRDYDNYEEVDRVLKSFHGIEMIINGAARGADQLSTKWADENKVPCLMFPALWQKEGKAAGILRNIRMLEEGQPDIVVGFPGGRGTSHMLSIAKASGVPYWDVSVHEEIPLEDLNRQVQDKIPEDRTLN